WRGRAIAKGDGEVAQPAFVTGAAQGGAFGLGEPGGFVPQEEFNQTGLVKLVAWFEGVVLRVVGKFVPGAHQLAVVAAEDAVAYQRAQFRVDGTVVLDVEIGDAAAGVELIGGDDGASGAYLHAGGTTAAVVAGRRVDGQRNVGV